jgi:hypothetical protein
MDSDEVTSMKSVLEYLSRIEDRQNIMMDRIVAIETKRSSARSTPASTPRHSPTSRVEALAALMGNDAKTPKSKQDE